MDHHNLAMIRGDRKNPALQGPKLAEYQELYEYIQRLWATGREERYGSIVEPMLQWAKIRTAAQGTQVVPCRAGVLTAVVYSNGDVSFCENHEPIGNLREQVVPGDLAFGAGRRAAASIRAKECTCTNEVFLWPSIVYQPMQLLRALIGAKPWRAVPPLTVRRAGFRPPRCPRIRSSPSAMPRSASEWEPVPMALPILSEPQD